MPEPTKQQIRQTAEMLADKLLGKDEADRNEMIESAKRRGKTITPERADELVKIAREAGAM